MSETTIDKRTYKGLPLRVKKHWSGSTTAVVFYYGRAYYFDSIKQAKSFINSVTGE